MNAILNGTGWGESPAVELKYPEWMSEPYFDSSNWDRNYNDARIAEAIGRERKNHRYNEKHRKFTRNSIIGFVGTVLMLMLIGTLIGG